MLRRLLSVCALALSLLITLPAAAFACGGLIAPGHAEVLQRATTLAAWHDGVEHYVTGFQFAGSADRFGYIIPLPGVPTSIVKGGGWTLERLEQEVSPVEGDVVLAAVPAAKRVEVLQSVKVGALDIKVVRGGGPDVAAWAKANGFPLTPDAPQVLGRYSNDGAVFALARFDRATAAQQGLIEGQGEVIQFAIPMSAPWVPLRILTLGKVPSEAVDADVFVLTDDRPTFAPALRDINGMTVRANGPASAQLLADLRSDKRMGWLPTHGMWFTALQLDTRAVTIGYDLSIDGGHPGFSRVPVPTPTPGPLVPTWVWWLGIGLLGVIGWGAVGDMRRQDGTPGSQPA
jgi:Uncharacterized protein conserved in bacteria (DUF2330)